MNITNDNDIDTYFMSPTYFMPSPLPQVFPSRKQLKDYLFDSARAKGYILKKSRSSADNYFILSCDRGGQYCNLKNFPEEESTRKSGTNGCMVSIKGLYRESYRKFTCRQLHHNHPPDEDLRVHPTATHLSTDNQFQELRTLELSEKTRILHLSTQPILCNLVGNLSHFALRKINEVVIKFKRATHDNSIRPCSRIMVDSMGLPCSHTIQQMGYEP